MHRRICILATLLSGCVLCAPAHADLLERLNQLRFKTCSPSAAKVPILRRNRGLDVVALEWSKGGRLTDAVARTRYPSQRLASMQVTGSGEDAQVVAVLRQSYCDILTDARYSEVGLLRRKGGVWIVVAAPLNLPSADDTAAIGNRVLELVNQARSRPRSCGAIEFAAAAPLRAATALHETALTHALDMAQHQHFQHEGTDGSSPGDRATRAGYAWSRVGENIALGTMNAEDTVQGWLDSPGHCANIMQPQFTEMGLGYAVTRNGKPSIYWSQVLGRPRS
jgi:uncharacterized protein YkwD